MQFLKKIRIPLIILILLVLVVLSIVIVRNILSVANRADEALDFVSEMPTNLDDVFTGNFLDDEIDIETKVTSDEPVVAEAEVVTSETVATEVDNILAASSDKAEVVVTEVMPVGKEDIVEVVNMDTPAPVTTIETVPTPIISTTPPTDEQAIKIGKLILEKHTASKKEPAFITIVVNADSNVEYASIKVFARRLANNNVILSRELVFGLPKVYIVNGQGQTQFYFGGRYASSNKYIKDGRYIMYVEVIGYDKDGNRVSGMGEYPMPQFDNVITLKN